MRVRQARGASAVALRTSCGYAASSSSRSLHHPFDGMRRRGTNGSSMAPVLMLVVLASCATVGDCRRWTVDELRSLKFPYSRGVNLGMAICKAAGFMQDAALMDDDIRQLHNVNRSFHKLLADEHAMRTKVHTLDTQEAVTDEDKRRALRKLANAGKKVRLVDARRGRRAATARTERVWPHGIIPYEIQANFSGEHKALFKKAMRHWENHTCISFVERTPQDENYIVFTVADCGCCSFVGKRGDGPQAISIGKNCDKFGIVVHELGHVVGFWHEHTRPDRDLYVDIFYKSIQQGQDYNFEKLKSDDVNSLGEPYDFASIMHYARDTFARAMYTDTILPKTRKENRPEIGQRVRLSEGDIRQANKLYQCPVCGRTLMNPSGVLSIDQDDRADDQTATFHCEWRIIATKGERIQLNITDLNLPPPDQGQCSSESDNFVIIRDGHFSGSPIIAKLCGSFGQQRVFQATGNRLFVELRSSRRRIEPTSNGADVVEPLKRGLSRPPISLFASYTAICGGELTADSGIIESPHYPENYPPDGRCTWVITVEEEFQVAIMFDLFSLEQHKDCIYDRLEVYEIHPSGDSNLLGRLCGQTIPENVKTLSSNKMRLEFFSDNSVQKSGFSLQFIQEFDECKTETHGCQHKCVNLLGSYKCECDIGYELNPDGKTCEDTCGGYIHGDNGTISSPNFPLLYPGGKRCVWEIEANPGYQITLNFTHLNVEGMKTACEYDYIKVMSMGDGDAESDNLGKFCGDYLEAFVVTSTTNRLRVEFVSDNSVEKTGFAAYFLTDLDECKRNKGGCQHRCINLIGSYKCECDSGFVLADDKHNCKEGGCNFQLKDPEGKIFSPNYPHDYPKGKTCAWHFVTTPGHRLHLQFDEFVLEEHTTCRYDKVQMYDGGSDAALTMGTYCGSQLPEAMTSTSNELYLVFHTDASVARRGFSAAYSSVCGGVLEADQSVGFIYSHARYSDHKYQKKMKCTWTIFAAPGMGVQLRFTQFSLEPENACEYDYVEILDGEGPDTSRFGRYCGEKLPPTFVSTGTALTLELYTDDSVEQKGFVAEYRLAEQGTEPPFTVSPPPTPRPSREPLVNSRD